MAALPRSVEEDDVASCGCGAPWRLMGRCARGAFQRPAANKPRPGSAPSPAQQVPTLLAEIQRLKTETAKAARRHEHVLAERDAAIAHAGRLRKRNKSTKAEKEQFAAALDDVTEGLYHERRAAREKADDAELKVAMLRKELADANSGRSAAEEVAAVLRVEAEDLRASGTAAEAARAQAQREADAAVAKQEQLRSALDNVVDGAQRELHNARAKAVADEREIETLREELAQKSARLAAANEERFAAERVTAQFRVQVENLHSIVTAAEAARDKEQEEKEVAVAEKERLKVALASALEDLQQERHAARANANAAEQEVATLRKELASTSACMEDAHDGRVAAEEQAASLRTQVAMLREELDDTNTRLKDADRKCSAAEHMATRLGEQVDDLRAYAADAEAACVKAREDGSTKTADNTQLAVALSCALQGMDHQRSAARVRASSVKRKMAALREDLVASRARLNDVETAFAMNMRKLQEPPNVEEHPAEADSKAGVVTDTEAQQTLATAAADVQLEVLDAAPLSADYRPMTLAGLQPQDYPGEDEPMAEPWAPADAMPAPEVVKGPATRTSEGSVFEESGDSDADGNECCSSNDIHNNSWQGSSDVDGDASRLEALDAVVIEDAQPLHALRQYHSPECRLGSGSTCDVTLWRGLNPDFDSAVKRIKCSTAYHVECVERELYALLAADGRPHCIGTTGCYWEPWNRKDGTRLGTKWYLAMPFMRGGSLCDVVDLCGGQLLESDGKVVMSCILQGLRAMHEGGYAHLDIKPANIGLAEEGDLNSVALLDYGSAEPVDGVVDWMTGTIQYACPGFAHAGAGHREPVNLRKGDSFSAGVLLYVLLTGTLPTPLPEEAPYAEYSAYFSRRAAGEEPDPVDAIFDLSEDALDLLRGLLAVDEGRRLSVEEALRHPWFDDLEVAPAMACDEYDPMAFDACPDGDDAAFAYEAEDETGFAEDEVPSEARSW